MSSKRGGVRCGARSGDSGFVGIGFDASSFLPVVCFGLFVPPLLMLLSHFANRRKEHPWLAQVREYVNLPEMMFWGGISLGLLGLLSLKSANAEEGYSVCAFFIAAGVGFLVGGTLENRLRQGAQNETYPLAAPDGFAAR